jgi:protoheme IX farnesyltransferase
MRNLQAVNARVRRRVRTQLRGNGRAAATPAARSVVAAYMALAKPRIIELLLVTTVPAMILAERGVPSLWLIAATLIGGTATAGGANAANQYLDRDIDEVMTRTRRRPLPAHRVRPGHALAFAITLEAVGVVWLALTVNKEAAALALGAALFYVFVYTIWLKRTSPQNIVVGGAAGAVPVLVGWAAVTGGIGWPALVLFFLIFLWTPPHFWALSMRYERDYAAAGIPMLPVVAGKDATARQILSYTLLVVVCSIVLIPVGHLGVLYTVSVAVLGGWFFSGAIRLRRRGTVAAAMALFRFSNAYLALLFLAVAVDTIVRHGV